MAKTTYYRQCILRKGSSRQTSYIPEQFAVQDKIIKLRVGGVWDDGWKVMEVSRLRRAEDALPDSHIDIKRHRKNTGDALPKV